MKENLQQGGSEKNRILFNVKELPTELLVSLVEAKRNGDRKKIGEIIKNFLKERDKNETKQKI